MSSSNLQVKSTLNRIARSVLNLFLKVKVEELLGNADVNMRLPPVLGLQYSIQPFMSVDITTSCL